MRAWQQSSY